MSDVHVDAGIRAAIDHAGGDAASLRASGWLSLAAAPTFALMALLTGVLGGSPMNMLCSAGHGASPLSGMALMYVLMSVFHVGPYARRLLVLLSNDNLERGRTPFLHVSHQNGRAKLLYEHAGYRLRRDIEFWSLSRT